ncbi:MAG: hypothetical protein Q9211_004139 [Gyalolechia sp. 1 TL-2023]
MDEATADLVLSLQLEDLNRLLDSPSTGNSNSIPSDYHLALTAYRDELTGRLSILHDRRMCRSIANAVVVDHGTLATVRKLENDAIRDQAAACRFDEQLNGELGEKTRKVATANRPASFIDLTDNVNDRGMNRLARLNSLQPGFVDLVTGAKSQRQRKSNQVPKRGVQGPTPENNSSDSQLQLKNGKVKPCGQDQQGAESSSKHKAVDGDDSTNERVTKASKLDHVHLSSDPPKRIMDADTVLDSERPGERVEQHGSFTGLGDPILGVKKTCASCNDSVDYFAAVSAPCGHDYCSGCAKRLFTLSTKDESLFPPRCCQQPIPLAAVEVFLTAEFIQQFRKKCVEYTSVDKTYCPWSSCSAFIPPDKINGDIAVCPECSFWVCTMCKGATHQGRDCPKDRALHGVVALAKEKGWQRCYHCKRYVELKHGCNRI